MGAIVIRDRVEMLWNVFSRRSIIESKILESHCIACLSTVIVVRAVELSEVVAHDM